MNQAEQFDKLVELFEEARGRPARTLKEFSEWLASAEGKRAAAYDTAADGKGHSGALG
jgi:hypothetical protein